MHETDTLVVTLMEWFGVYRRHLMSNTFAYAKDKGLTMGQLGALLHINHKRACGVSDIGSDLGVTNSAASQMLDRLVQLKLITRSENPDDRREKQIVLTDEGNQILLENSRAFQSWLVELADSMDNAEQEQVRKGLLILIEKAKQREAVTN